MTHDVMPARIVDKQDGHGAQFEIQLEGGVTAFPADVLAAIKSEFQHGATLYVDQTRIEGNDITISLCRGSIQLASVLNRWNSRRNDLKFRVIVREEVDSDENPNLPQIVG